MARAPRRRAAANDSALTTLAATAEAGGSATTAGGYDDRGRRRRDGGRGHRGGGATTTLAAPSPAPAVVRLADLGTLTTPDDVRIAIESLGERATGSAGSGQATVACPLPAPGATIVGLATWRGTAAAVYRVEGPARAVVVAVATCKPLAEVPLA